jgi:hypothetical protein
LNDPKRVDLLVDLDSANECDERVRPAAWHHRRIAHVRRNESRTPLRRRNAADGNDSPPPANGVICEPTRINPSRQVISGRADDGPLVIDGPKCSPAVRAVGSSAVFAVSA